MKKKINQTPKIINGKFMKYSSRYNVWVNREGTYAYREYNDSKLNGPLKIHQREDGSKFLNTKSPGIIELDQLVADCFYPMPQDGKKYILNHKDGKKENCDFSNLEWQQVPKFNPLGTHRTLPNGITVSFEGKFYEGEQELTLVKEVGDADTNRIVAIDPYVEYYRRNYYKSMSRRTAYPDDLMVEAEFVEGDPSLLQHPRIVHLDMDYLNFSFDNLKWVEEDSLEYQEYIIRKQADIDALTIALNPNHPNPLMK